jgi:hypothetical protein
LWVPDAPAASPTTPGPAELNAGIAGDVNIRDTNTSQESGTSGTSSATGTSSALEVDDKWPADTNIVFLPGTRKVTLTCQRPMVRIVIQDGMDKVRADLLINHAFPDPYVALTSVREALKSSALDCGGPSASDIHRRLVFDEDYMDTLMPLVRSSILMTTLLTSSSSSGTCSDSAFPRRSQRAVQHYRPI